MVYPLALTMSIRVPFVVFILLALVMTATWLRGESHTMDFVQRRADGISHKRVESRMWGGEKNSQLLQKRFPIEDWEKHYSSIGTKKAPISVNESIERKEFKTETKHFETKSFEMSRWNKRLTELQKQARIGTDASVKKAADQKLYSMMLQDTQKYEEMGKELSLREINRFQFRRNRPDGGVPVRQAGSGE